MSVSMAYETASHRCYDIMQSTPNGTPTIDRHSPIIIPKEPYMYIYIYTSEDITMRHTSCNAEHFLEIVFQAWVTLLKLIFIAV